MNLTEKLHGIEDGYDLHKGGHDYGYSGSLVRTPIRQGLGLVANLSFLKDPGGRRRRTLVAFGRATSDEALTASIYDLAVRSVLSYLFRPMECC